MNYFFLLCLALNSLILATEKGTLLHKYPLVIEKLVLYKKDYFKAFYGGPVDRNGDGVKWIMPVTFDNLQHKTRAVYEIAYINCVPETAENADVVFSDVSDVDIKLKNNLTPDYAIFSMLLNGNYNPGQKYVVVRYAEIANVYYPDIFVDSLTGKKKESDKLTIVNYLNKFFKTKKTYIDYFNKPSTDLLDSETDNLSIYQPRTVQVRIDQALHAFNVLKVIKKNDTWKSYYLIYPASLSLSDLSSSEEPVIVRLDSGCVSGQIYDDEACDCLDQLHAGLHELVLNEANKGLIIHIPSQDGRGFGTAPKAETEIYKRGGHGRIHSTSSLNTVAAAKLLYGCDEYEFRSFDGAAEILADFNIKQVILLTDNKDKVSALQKHGIEVVRKKTETNKATCLEHIEAKKNSEHYFKE
jgi:GTP cyclohydrolase II